MTFGQPKPRAAERGHPLRRARNALARGDHKAALAAFEEAILADPSCTLAHLGAALSLVELGRADEAERALGAALDADAPDAGALIVVARACAAKGQYPLAMTLLGRALTAHPRAGAAALAEPAFGALRDHPLLHQALGTI